MLLLSSRKWKKSSRDCGKLKENEKKRKLDGRETSKSKRNAHCMHGRHERRAQLKLISGRVWGRHGRITQQPEVVPYGGFGQDLPCYPPLSHGSSRFDVDDRRAPGFRAPHRWECLSVCGEALRDLVLLRPLCVGGRHPPSPSFWRLPSRDPPATIRPRQHPTQDYSHWSTQAPAHQRASSIHPLSVPFVSSGAQNVDLRSGKREIFLLIRVLNCLAPCLRQRGRYLHLDQTT